MFGVDARTAQKEQLLHARPATAFNHVRLHDEVVVQKVRLVSVVGVDAAHFGCRQVHVHGLHLLQKRKHRRLISEIQLGRSAKDQVGVTTLFQGPNQR